MSFIHRVMLQKSWYLWPETLFDRVNRRSSIALISYITTHSKLPVAAMQIAKNILHHRPSETSWSRSAQLIGEPPGPECV